MERLRTKRQAKIDELKEKINYYITQQPIQRYDPDPTSKAAAATVLASKLEANSSLKVYLGDDSKMTSPTEKRRDVEVMPSKGLWNRKQLLTRVRSADSTILHPHVEEMLHQTGFEASTISTHRKLAIEHHDPTSFCTDDSGWLALIAALLEREDPTQSYAEIVTCTSVHINHQMLIQLVSVQI